MKILVINAGSSSLKYQLIDMENESLLAKGLCERIGIDGRLTHKVPSNGKPVYEADVPMPTHKEAIEAVLEHADQQGIRRCRVRWRRSTPSATACSTAAIKFVESCVVDDACEARHPRVHPRSGLLHNPANLMGIEACEKAMPGKPQVAVFDTAFHMTMPPKAYRYAIPTKYYDERLHLRRYGFHGTSHRFVSKRCHRADGRRGKRARASSSATSATAPPSPPCMDGKCQDTSMGLSPLAGVSDGHPRRRYRHLRRAVHHEQVQHVPPTSA